MRQDELSLEGSGDASCTGRFEATSLLSTLDSFSDFKFKFGVAIFE